MVVENMVVVPSVMFAHVVGGTDRVGAVNIGGEVPVEWRVVL